MRIIFFLLFLIPFCTVAQKRYHIVGSFKNKTKSKTITIGDNTIPIKNNQFEVYGYVNSSAAAFINTEKSFNWAIWLAPGEYKIEVEEWQQADNKKEKDFLRITKMEGPSEAMQFVAMQEYQSTLMQSAFQKKITQDSVNYFYCQKILSYANKVKQNALLDYFLTQLPNDVYTVQLLKDIAVIQKSTTYSTTIEAKKLLLKGKLFQDFNNKTNVDTTFQLYSIKAKYILIDFWASWCGPCRRKHPYFVNLYKKYKDKGFAIVSVSLDTDKGKWRTAIKQDKLEWTNVSELKSWQGLLPKKYAVTQIPFNIFLNEKFEVITTDASLGVMEAFLKELK